MSTDYTPAKDRLLVALAKVWDDCAFGNVPVDLATALDDAARAVLEEEKGKAGVSRATDGCMNHAPDSLDAIRHEMIDCAQEIATAGADSELPLAAHLRTWARRIEALIPSKAEVEFMAQTLEWGAYYDRTFKTEENWSQEEGDMLRAYRAVLAERGKDG